MFVKRSLEERCRGILEEKGGKIADAATTILLKERSLTELRSPLEHISKNWRDPATPSMIILACEAVGGRPGKAIFQAGLAMALMNLSFNLWDDLADRTLYRGFVPTVMGKFGEGITLMIGGLASAKAFSVLGEMKIDDIKRLRIMKLVWDYWEKLAKAEIMNLELRHRSDVKPEEKLKVIKMEGVGIETSLKIGAVIGNGSEDEIQHLGKYGRYLSTILDLRKDFNTSINLTFQLVEKIRSGALPYTLLWARNHSEKIKEYLQLPADAIKPIDVKKIVEIVLETKALENVMGLLKTVTRNGEKELHPLKSNKATKTLKFFLNAQCKIFTESLFLLYSLTDSELRCWPLQLFRANGE